MALRNAKATYQIKVTLRGVKPPIWRRLHVEADMSLSQLHEVLQVAMGWHGYHLHEFECGGERFGPPDYAENFGLPPVRSERTTRLSSVLSRAGAKALYSYDFGDGWEHSIVLEKVLEPEPGRAHPVCVAGKRNCPPEDCGGPYGYYMKLEARNDPGHPEHGETLEWMSEDFDPEAFSIEAVNRRLA